MKGHFHTRFTSVFFLLPVLLFSTACATTEPPPPPTPQNVWFCTPPKHVLSDKHIHVELIPHCSYWGCTGFQFSLKNKSDRQLKINWNETYYMRNGQQEGGFIFGGIVYKDRYEEKAPEILAGNRKFTRTIWPNDLVFFDDRWRHRPMEAGEHGIAFSISIAEGIEINGQLSMNLTPEAVTPGDQRTPCMAFTRPAATKEDWTGISVVNTHLGVGVVNVFLSSPATYKILPGDIIKQINNRPIPDKYIYLETTLGLKDSTSPVVFLIEREGEELSIPLR